MKTTAKQGCIYWGAWGSDGKIYVMKNGMTYCLIHDHGAITLIVDINGKKGPNRLGRDGFAFRISKKTNVLEFPDSNYSRDKLLWSWNGCGDPGFGGYYNGLDCSTLIWKDGWQIKEDYPW